MESDMILFFNFDCNDLIPLWMSVCVKFNLLYDLLIKCMTKYASGLTYTSKYVIGY